MHARLDNTQSKPNFSVATRSIELHPMELENTAVMDNDW